MKPKASSPRVTIVSRRPGRPAGSTRVDEPRKSVASWLPASAHDRLIQVANAKETSVSDLVRQVIILNIVNVFPASKSR